jgi:hypothetical protein
MIDDTRTESRRRFASRPRPELALIEVPPASDSIRAGCKTPSTRSAKPVCIGFSSRPKSSASMSRRIADA